MPDRLPALEAFWQCVSKHKLPLGVDESVWQSMSFVNTVSCGIPGFFSPTPWAHLGGHIRLGAENAAYYSTEPLRRTLAELVDFERMSALFPPVSCFLGRRGFHVICRPEFDTVTLSGVASTIV